MFESKRQKELCYGLAQQKFGEWMKMFEYHVAQFKDAHNLILTNAPWESIEAKASVAEPSEAPATESLATAEKDASPPSFVIQTLEALKKEN